MPYFVHASNKCSGETVQMCKLAKTFLVGTWDKYPGLQIGVHTGKLFFLFLNQTYVVGTQKNRLNETLFEHPKHTLKLMGKEINAILGAQTILIWTYGIKISCVNKYMSHDM